MSPKKHILILASWYPNKYNDYNGNFIKRIAEVTSVEFKVTVLHMVTVQGDDAVCLEKKQINNYLQEWTYYKPKGKLSFITEGLRHIKAIEAQVGKIDFIHVQVIWNMGLLAYIQKRLYGTPYVITEHWTGYYEEDYQLNRTFMKYFTRKIARKSAGFICVSESLSRKMTELGIIYTEPVILWNIVKEADIDCAKNSKQLIHVSNGRDFQKNVSGILRSFAKALKSVPELELLCVGIQDSQPYISLINDLNIGSQVRLLGPVEHQEVLKYICESAALVSFSNFETFGITCAESMSLGVPVIYTACGGPEEFLDSNSGIEVPIRDEQKLAEAMEVIGSQSRTFNHNTIKLRARSIFSADLWLKHLTAIYKAFNLN